MQTWHLKEYVQPSGMKDISFSSHRKPLTVLQAGEVYQVESWIEKLKAKCTADAKRDIFQYILVINRLDCTYF